MAHLHSSLSSPSTGVDKSTGVRSHVVVKSGVVYYKPAKMTFLKVSNYMKSDLTSYQYS